MNTIVLMIKINEYANRINSPSTKSLLRLNGTLDTSSEVNCRTILSDRYDHIEGLVFKHIESLIP